MRISFFLLAASGFSIASALPAFPFGITAFLANKIVAPSPANSTQKSPPLNGPGFTSGVAYSHYTAAGQCRTQGAVQIDVAALIARGHDLIRIYDFNCDGPANLWNAVNGTNASMFLGIFDITQAEAGARSIAAQLGNNWSHVNTISVGNEVVNDGGSPAAVIAAMNIARITLRSLGYTGPVVTTDTMVAVMNHPELCTSADYCSMNCHAFFDGGWIASQAGLFVNMFINIIQAKIGNQPIVISESGWPHGGFANRQAVPDLLQQSIAIASLKQAMPTNMILYSAYNEYWLPNNAATHGAENYWGVYGDSPGGL